MAGVLAAFALLVLLFSFLNPPTNIYQIQGVDAPRRIERDWVSWDEIAPVMGRSAGRRRMRISACTGASIWRPSRRGRGGRHRGASTISQQVVKNVFLWHGRSWLRKALEGVLTPAVELVWSKQRIIEVYLNIAEFDEGVFGVQAAAQHHFGVDARDLTATQAARLAAVLPDPREEVRRTVKFRAQSGAVDPVRRGNHRGRRALCLFRGLNWRKQP